jgi:hypothetical protein
VIWQQSTAAQGFSQNVQYIVLTRNQIQNMLLIWIVGSCKC